MTAAQSRIALFGAGVIVGAAGVWFAVSWIDHPYDETCSAVVYPDVWISGRLAGRCRGVMLLRTGVTAMMLASSLVLAWLALRRRTLSTGTAATVGIVVSAAAAVILTANEVVRSGGALS